MNAVMEHEKYETNVLFFFISFDIFVFLDLGVIFFFFFPTVGFSTLST